MGSKQAFVKEWKKKKVNELVNLISKYSTIGLIDLTSLPSSQLQVIRGRVRDGILIKCSKKSFIKRALEQTGHKDLIGFMEGSPALILSNLQPFKIFKLIEENKSLSPIKAGQIAPRDLVVPAGETPFTPGPIIGELGSIGVKAKIVGGKISILKDAVVVKQGEPAGEIAAKILSVLGIKPMEVGLNMIAAESQGIVYKREDLDIDVESMISAAYNYARNLVLNTGMIVASLIEDIIQKAHMNALMLNAAVHPESRVEAQHEEKKEEEKKEEKEEEQEEVKEEDIAQGLSDLFG